MANANPSRPGDSLGSDARSTGESQNESTPPEQRAPKSNVKPSAGPKIDPKTGGFLPAAYPVGSGRSKLIRYDR